MRTALFLGLAVAVLAGLFYLLRPEPAAQVVASVTHPGAPVSPGLPPSGAQKFELRIENRKLVAGGPVLKARQGDAVEIRVVSDQAEELHLHGYNLKLELQPGQPATLAFSADRSGRFDYELEHAGIELGALEVSPR
jgi:hypothetical protein